MAERTKATVLKTVDGATHPWVRIPLLPPADVETALGTLRVVRVRRGDDTGWLKIARTDVCRSSGGGSSKGRRARHWRPPSRPLGAGIGRSGRLRPDHDGAELHGVGAVADRRPGVRDRRRAGGDGRRVHHVRRRGVRRQRSRDVGHVRRVRAGPRDPVRDRRASRARDRAGSRGDPRVDRAYQGSRTRRRTTSRRSPTPRPRSCGSRATSTGTRRAAATWSLQLLYELADRDDCVVTNILANAIVVVIPCQNPDGREADTRRNAYGFDLNRDVFARTQPETDGRVELWRQLPAGAAARSPRVRLLPVVLPAERRSRLSRHR